jgi:hypothetical protein
MKKLLLVLLLAVSGYGIAQTVTVTGAGNTSLNKTYTLCNGCELSLPQLTATDITAIASPQKGMLVYDLTNNCLKLYNGTGWVCLTTSN